MQSIQDKIIEKLQLLPEATLSQVLDYVESLAQGTTKEPVGVPGKQLLRFAGTIPCEELELMVQAIEADCGKVDIKQSYLSCENCF
ncbi:hypothetical protein SD80_005220 [Scytonema tolypothrichoides VB-61278]|nr:hypothetical protein SD80_005220 [Scytonema tolypothrichoides VB-61278]